LNINQTISPQSGIYCFGFTTALPRFSPRNLFLYEDSTFYTGD
jgi:hypothetical protein